MKLLLSSAGFENPKIGNKFIELTGQKPENIVVLLIPTAAITKKDLFYIEETKKELEAVGIKKENIITYNLDSKKKAEDYAGIDVIYVSGGNTFYLLNKLKKTGFDQEIIKLVKSGKVYFGVSAGSIITTPNISTAAPYDENKVDLKDLSGLKLINQLIHPHYIKDDDLNIAKLRSQNPDYEIITLTDQQALLVINNKSEIIE